MESEKIKQLLEKYWACETSLEEEKQLKEFFSQPNLSPNWAKHQAMFQFFKAEGEQEIIGDFEESLTQKIKIKELRPKRNMLFYNMMRVAASLLIVLGCAYFYQQDAKPTETAVMQDTFTDPEEAYAEVKKALLKVSKDLNTGTEYMVSIKKINQGTKHFKTEQKSEK